MQKHLQIWQFTIPRQDSHVSRQGPLERQHLVCPELFAEERRKIFWRSWVPVGRIEWLGDRQRYFTAEISDCPLIAVHGDDGTIRCFHNTCRHRGAQLLPTGTAGVLSSSGITCPYHAWRYDARGQLRNAPNVSRAECFADHGLDEVPCCSWNGYLMVNLGGDRREFSEYFQPITELLSAWGMSDLRIAAELTYDVAANWKLLFQNYSECYHCPSVHPQLNRLSPFRSASNDLIEGPFLGGPMQLADSAESMTTDGRAIAEPLPGLDAAGRRQVGYYTLFPGMFISPHPDFVMVHRIRPVAWDATQVICEFLTTAMAETDVTRAVAFWDQVNREDWHVCELVQLGAKSPRFRCTAYTDLESTVAAFDRHYFQAMSV